MESKQTLPHTNNVKRLFHIDFSAHADPVTISQQFIKLQFIHKYWIYSMYALYNKNLHSTFIFLASSTIS